MVGMFDGSDRCVLCKKEIEGKDRFFGVSLVGKTHAFCRNCFENKKEEVQDLLHD